MSNITINRNQVSSCNVCVEDFNKKNHKTECPYCHFEVCKKCNEKYLLDSHEDAHCMNCKKHWNYNVLLSLFTRKFVDITYKKHFEHMLFEREMTLFPSTQIAIEQERYRESVKSEMTLIQNEIIQLKRRLTCLKIKYDNPKQNYTLIKKCPEYNCKGYLSSDWKCGICEKFSCKDCNQVLGEYIDVDHLCKTEDIETAKLLQKETKPCPNCSIPIYKLEGCDQMFCVQCKTPFSWKTLKIVKGQIHNPHYLEMVNNNGNQERNPLETRCGREIDEIIPYVDRYFSQELYNISINIRTIQRFEMPKLINNANHNNLDLRKRYLKSEISEDEFKKQLQKRHKQKIKNKEILDVLYMYTNTSIEILYRYLDMYGQKYGPQLIPISPIHYNVKYEIDELRNYTNQCFVKIGSTYKASTRVYINDNGTINMANSTFITRNSLSV